MSVQVKKSPIDGWGVFAVWAIEEGDWEYLYGKLIKLEPGNPMIDYAFEWDDERVYLPYAPFCYLNHSDDPNCEVDTWWSEEPPILTITALRNIEPNEELTISYGNVDWVKWMPVPGYEHIYEVSDSGNIRSLDRLNSRGYKLCGKVLHPTVGKNGYPFVTLTKNSCQKKFYVHTVVMLAFQGPCPNGLEVRHLDGNRTNPKLNNLKYGTRIENMQDAILHGTTRAKAVLRSDGRWFRTIQEAADASGISSHENTNLS
jgi:hypothetical protein